MADGFPASPQERAANRDRRSENREPPGLPPGPLAESLSADLWRALAAMEFEREQQAEDDAA